MSEHGPATTSEFDWSKSTQMLAREAREQAAQAGEYVARNVHEYPFPALIVAGLIGYGIGFLLHTSWTSEPRKQTSAPQGHSGDILQPLE
jgi:hypothetical protein